MSDLSSNQKNPMQELRGIVENQAAGRQFLPVEMALLRRVVATPEPPAVGDREDMENIGRAFMDSIARHLPGYSWSDCPSEVIVDLVNQRDDARASQPPPESHWLWVASLALQITAPDVNEDETEWRVEGHSGRSHSYRGATLVEALKDFWDSEIRSRDMEGNPTEPDRPLPSVTKSASPHGKPCTCDTSCGGSLPCYVESGGKLGDLWYCRKRASTETTGRIMTLRECMEAEDGFPCQQMEASTAPLTHQEIFSAVHHWASEIVRVTAAVPAQCTGQSETDGRL